jgi:DNA-binding response OmpR family regulator
MSRARRVMIVDDEPNVRLVFRAALEADGYEVAEAGDGEEAVDRLRGAPVDLILLDLRMPRLDGMETLRHLRAVGDDTPVVVVTAHGGVPDAVAAMKLGANDFLEKPMTPEALRGVVSEVLGRHAASPPGPAATPPEPAPAAARFAEKLARARRALDRREFDEAEFFLGQALGLDPRSAEAAHLRDALHERRRAHEGPYRVLRDLFPVGRPRRGAR